MLSVHVFQKRIEVERLGFAARLDLAKALAQMPDPQDTLPQGPHGIDK